MFQLYYHLQLIYNASGRRIFNVTISLSIHFIEKAHICGILPW